MALVEEAQAAARLLKEHAYLRVLARDDAESYCAVALLAHALRREGIDLHASWLDAADVVDLDEGEPVLRVGLDDAAPTLDVASGATRARLAADASLGGLAQLVAVALAPRNADLALLAAASAIAARRHVDGLRGLDADILREAVAAGSLHDDRALALRGGTLLSALSQADEPFVPGLSGRARNAKKVVAELSLPGDAPPSALSPADVERVGSLLALRLLESGAPTRAVDALARPRIRAARGPHTGMDAADLAWLAEAAAIARKGGLAFAALWPDEAAANEVADLAAAQREEIVGALLKAEREARREGALLVVDAPRAELCAPLADRVALALAQDGSIVAARHASLDSASVALRSFGRELARVRDAALACGGSAVVRGSAARARVPPAEAERFLKLVAEAFG